ncbi:MAG: protease modulator HflC, partial [Candidatus Cloacimonetes bacterium]|nr:protease modulator HflC [Candidatus Cloacimonadota bacterium]
MKLQYKLIILIAALIVLSNAFYIIDETEQVIITRFGNPVGKAYITAGMHAKIPFIDKVNSFEKRILEWDGDPKQIVTSDKKYIWLDTFARWQIVEPLIFFQKINNERQAHSRLDDIISGTSRDIITLNSLIEIVRNSNRELSYTEDYDASLDDSVLA